MVIKTALPQSELLYTFLHILAVNPRTAHTGQISFDVSQKNRHSRIAEGLCQNFKGDGLSCACCTCNQPVAVGHLRLNTYLFSIGFADPYFIIVKHILPPWVMM